MPLLRQSAHYQPDIAAQRCDLVAVGVGCQAYGSSRFILWASPWAMTVGLSSERLRLASLRMRYFVRAAFMCKNLPPPVGFTRLAVALCVLSLYFFIFAAMPLRPSPLNVRRLRGLRGRHITTPSRRAPN